MNTERTQCAMCCRHTHSQQCLQGPHRLSRPTCRCSCRALLEAKDGLRSVTPVAASRASNTLSRILCPCSCAPLHEVGVSSAAALTSQLAATIRASQPRCLIADGSAMYQAILSATPTPVQCELCLTRGLMVQGGPTRKAGGPCRRLPVLLQGAEAYALVTYTSPDSFTGVSGVSVVGELVRLGLSSEELRNSAGGTTLAQPDWSYTRVAVVP